MPTTPTTPTKAQAVVIGIELAGFAKRSVGEQFKQREHLHQRLAAALRSVVQKDRIVLETAVGCAIVLFGKPSQGLAIATTLCGTRSAEPDSVVVRASLALGPIEAVTGDKGETHVAGSALEVIERLTGQVESEKLLCTRPYMEALRQEEPACAAALKALEPLQDSAGPALELFGLQLSHPSLHAWRRKRGGKATRPVSWFSFPAAAICTGVLAVLVGWLWSTRSPVEDARAAVTPAAAAPVPAAISIIRTVTPTPLPEEPARVVDLAPSQATPPEASAAPTTRDSHQSDLPPAPKSRKALSVAKATPIKPSGTPVAEQSIETRDVLSDAPVQRGRVLLAIAPWGEVLIDGKSVGISPPLTEMELPAGPHYVEVRNSAADPVLRRIEIQANETLKIRHRFADSR